MRVQLLLLFLSMIVFFTSCEDNKNENLYTSVVEGTTVQVPALIGGLIKQLRVESGDEITANSIIAIVDTLELSYQREQLLASLEELTVQREIAQTTLNQAKTNEAYLQEKQQRIAALFKTNSTSRQSLDDINTGVRQAALATAQARQRLQTILSKRKQINAQLATLNKKIQDAVITAPLAGIITQKYFEAGEAIPPMSPIVEITEIYKVDIKIYVSAQTLPGIQYEESVKVRTDGLDQDLSGRVSWISPRAEFTPKSILTPETRSSLVYAVKIRVENPNGLLKHGMPVEVELN